MRYLKEILKELATRDFQSIEEVAAYLIEQEVESVGEYIEKFKYWGKASFQRILKDNLNEIVDSTLLNSKAFDIGYFLESNYEQSFDNSDSLMGKELLRFILEMKPNDLLRVLGKQTIKDFIDTRCESYDEALTEAYNSDDFTHGNIGHIGVKEKARAVAFEGMELIEDFQEEKN